MVQLHKHKANLKRLRNTPAAKAARSKQRAFQLDSTARSQLQPVLSVRPEIPSTGTTSKESRTYALPRGYLRAPISPHAAAQSASRLPRPAPRKAQAPHLTVQKAKPSRLIRSVRRNRLRPWATRAEAFGYASDVRTLRKTLEKDVVVVSLDTEFERRGIGQYVVEIGASIIRSRDLIGRHPGPYCQNYYPLIEHHHIVVDSTRFPKSRMSSSRFGPSKFLDGSEAKAALIEMLRSLASTSDDEEDTKLVFVGHSLKSDFAALLRCPDIKIDLVDLCNSDIPGLQIEAMFDTNLLGLDARKHGIWLPNLQLGPMARGLGIDPMHFDKQNSLKGTHNALNDAAYTLYAMLLMAINWDLYPKFDPRNRSTLKGPLDVHTMSRKERKAYSRHRYLQERMSQSTSPTWMQWLIGTIKKGLGFESTGSLAGQDGRS